MTDDHARAARNEAHTNAALAMANFITSDPTEQVAAMLTAATVLIEREVGKDMAPAALGALLEPTVAGWYARAPGEAVQ